MKLIGLILLVTLCCVNTLEQSLSWSTVIGELVEEFVRFEPYELPKVKDDCIVRFFVIGDWGEMKGYFSFRKVSLLMEQLSSKNNYSHIITVGDNFYGHGIENIKMRIKPWLFTRLLNRDHTGQLKIHPTLGNHDCPVNYRNEILYSNYNKQWEMPNDYYVVETPLKDGSNKTFVNIMANSCKLLCRDGKWPSKKGCQDMKTELESSEVIEHYEWLEKQLAYYSTANATAWLAVTLHHPPFLYSGYKEFFLPLLRKYKVHIIFAGHEHYVEYSQMTPDYELRFPGAESKILIGCEDDNELMIHEGKEQTFKKGDHLHQFVSGNGGQKLVKICPFRDQDGEVFFKNNGYYGIAGVEVTSQKFTLKFYKKANEIVYTVHILNE